MDSEIVDIGATIEKKLKKEENGQLSYNPDYLIVVKPDASSKKCKYIMPKKGKNENVIFVQNGNITKIPEQISMTSDRDPIGILFDDMFKSKKLPDVVFKEKVTGIPIIPAIIDIVGANGVSQHYWGFDTGEWKDGFRTSANYKGNFITSVYTTPDDLLKMREVRYDFILLPSHANQGHFVAKYDGNNKAAKMLILNNDGSYKGEEITVTDLSSKRKVFVFNAEQTQAFELKPYIMKCFDKQGRSLEIQTWQPEGRKEFCLPEGWDLHGVRDMKGQPVPVGHRPLIDTPVKLPSSFLAESRKTLISSETVNACGYEAL